MRNAKVPRSTESMAGRPDRTWDESHLDPWLTNPQAMVPGAIMPYRQAKPEVRAAIIGYLKELK